MNLDKPATLDTDPNEFSKFEYLGAENIFHHSRLEKLDRENNIHSHKLETLVDSLPENSPQKEEAMGILERINEKMSERLRVLILAVGVLSPLIPTHSVAADIDPQTTIENTYRQSSEASESFKTLQDRVWTDDFESAFLLLGKEGEEEKIFELKGQSGNTEMRSSAEQQVEMIEKSIEILDRENIELGDPETGSLVKITQHNHPAQLLTGMYDLSDDHIEKMESGEMPTPVLPPSTIDLFVAQQRVSNLDYIGHVAEPSGTWTYREDKSHPIVQIVQKETEDDMNNLNNYSTKTSEYEELDKVVLSVVGMQILEIEKKVMEDHGISYEDTFLNIKNLAADIRTNSIAGEDVSGLITEYIKQAGFLGMNVTYTPN